MGRRLRRCQGPGLRQAGPAHCRRRFA
jgi:hypothetical protein